MIAPVVANDEFLAQVAKTGSDPAAFHLWWLGQSGFLVQWHGHHLLLDPYLSDSLTRKYAGTDKPHIRMTSRVVSPDRLDFIDVVSSSHNHTDHLDAETLVPLCERNSQLGLVVGAANRGFAAERLGVNPDRLIALDAGQSAVHLEFKFTAVPAAHEALERDEHGCFKFLGFVVEFGPWTIYHSGDTVRYPQMTEWLKPWKFDLMLLPINGRKPERGVAGNLDGPEAAQLARDCGARLVIPCHFDMFEFNTASPAAFARRAADLGQAYRVLQNGQHWSSAELGD
jgi:L-ascorbate metabolism protein UlaG (beta-lactamase superfamily)